MTRTSHGIGYDRAGPRGSVPIVFLHAGVADRRMWEPFWPALAADRDVLRLDFRGFGESTERPDGPLAPVDDVLATLAELGIERCHLVGASFGAGVAVEVALTRPDLVRSLLLAAPGGALITERTPDLARFAEAEEAALAAGDLTGAIEANLAWWVDGPHRDATAVDPGVRQLVDRMQRLAFELTADWDDVETVELAPAALDRVAAPTLVLHGELDLTAIAEVVRRLTDEVPDVRQVRWPDVAHLPSLERPADFLQLLRDWLDEVETS